ncbi:MAG: hypothetical protein FWD81_05750 [Methanomassiliicoccaceae archaeon]|nr:hypothetical protein [Methanomassiliicoccaceae archaeon]
MEECTRATRNCSCMNLECPRHGKCCECVAFHRDVKMNLPVCLRKE